jgi:hypothetical protein
MTELLLGIIAVLFGAVTYFTKRIMDDTKKIQAELKPMTPAIIEIQNKFTGSGHTIMFPLTVSPGSPLKLTDYGKKVLEDFGFNVVFKHAKAQLISQVIAMDPKTNYDIQEDAKVVIRDTFNSNDPVFTSLKEYAFDNGLPVELVIPPASIVLRDEVMTQLRF